MKRFEQEGTEGAEGRDKKWSVIRGQSAMKEFGKIMGR